MVRHTQDHPPGSHVPVDPLIRGERLRPSGSWQLDDQPHPGQTRMAHLRPLLGVIQRQRHYRVVGRIPP